MPLFPSPLPRRCVFMRLATICVLVFTLGSKITSCGDSTCELCGYNQKLYPVSHRLGSQLRGRSGPMPGIVKGLDTFGRGMWGQLRLQKAGFLCWEWVF